MIISRTPFRVSFVGGGSDLPEFYRHRVGYVLSTTINKYMYVSVHPYFYPNKSQLKYSRTELVENLEQIQHPVLRVVMKRLSVFGVEIDSVADVPASTGLGSSSAFTVGLLQALYAYNGKYVSKERLAQEACSVEIEDLGEPIGKQDQYASAFGGLNLISFDPSGRVQVDPVVLPFGTVGALENNLMLFFTGITRKASSVLAEQKQNMTLGSPAHEVLSEMADMALQLRKDLCEGRADTLGETLHRAWMLKRKVTGSITNSLIDRFYEVARNNGAIGGKLLGAGGGGFLLLYAYPDAQVRVRQALSELQELPFGFDNTGTSIIHVGDR